jgi:hypothetical protein
MTWLQCHYSVGRHSSLHRFQDTPVKIPCRRTPIASVSDLPAVGTELTEPSEPSSPTELSSMVKVRRAERLPHLEIKRISQNPETPSCSLGCLPIHTAGRLRMLLAPRPRQPIRERRVMCRASVVGAPGFANDSNDCDRMNPIILVLATTASRRRVVSIHVFALGTNTNPGGGNS